ncbi:MAG: ion channel [Eubacteriales bacterium]|nr:ion channel [Eubacteriales bacterium]
MLKITKRHLLYDIISGASAVTAVILILIDYSEHLSPWQLALNRGIWLIFILDYVTRLIKAPYKERFFVHNIWDLAALLPFHGIFPCCPVKGIDSLLRLLNLGRILAFLCRPLKKAARFLNTNGFKYMIFITTLTILAGGVMIHFAENMSFEDGIWWAFVTATTVGYGDISPHSFYGRIIAMVLMLVGIGLLGSITSTLTSYFMQSPSKTVRDKTLEMIQEQLTHFDELTDSDIDEIYTLLKAMKHKRTISQKKQKDEKGRKNRKHR